MLKLVNIHKNYCLGSYKQVALEDININFRKSEFVAVTGISGSGKTTLLNIIGGLDSYDSGDLLINGESTKSFLDRDWDRYRNHSIGFIFQNYQLIPNLTVLENVELGMTLSGASLEEKKKRALQVLEKVGLKEHLKKKSTQLSGGQMQRVAIARALANDPDIILADEPTGSLDTKTSVQIIDLIREIAKEKLVIMVTHNPKLAEEYANRIIHFQDGKLISDSNPFLEEDSSEELGYSLKNTTMNFLTALNLSARNASTRKFRLILTVIASSIGIIGVALILSLANGFKEFSQKQKEEDMKSYPVMVCDEAHDSVASEKLQNQKVHSDYPTEKEVIPRKAIEGKEGSTNVDEFSNYVTHYNLLTDSYENYVNKMDKSFYSFIGSSYSQGMNLIRKTALSVGALTDTSDSEKVPLSRYFLNKKGKSHLEKYYSLLAGKYPSSADDLILIIDTTNELPHSILDSLGFGTDKNISFLDLLSTNIKLVPNDRYYQSTGGGKFAVNKADDAMFSEQGLRTLRISGILRSKKGVINPPLAAGLAVNNELTKVVHEMNKNSAIVKTQKSSKEDVLTNQVLDSAALKARVDLLGGSDGLKEISIFPINGNSRKKIVSYLKAWNKHKKSKDQVKIDDHVDESWEMMTKTLNGVTMILGGIASISLIVSTIMIGIITYVSVLERTREIGILRALGARKKDITRVFNAETFIIGASAGAFGVLITYLFSFPINAMAIRFSEINDLRIAHLKPLHAVFLIVLSISLTFIGGLIPAKLAARKNPVEALRSE